MYNARKRENDIDLEDYRIKYIPPPPPTPEQIEAEKIKKAEAFKLKAEEITQKINNTNKLEIVEEFG